MTARLECVIDFVAGVEFADEHVHVLIDGNRAVASRL